MAAPLGEAAAAAPPATRAALRRLWGYARHNLGLYGLWLVTAVGYAGLTVAVPLAVGWAVEGVAQSVSREELYSRVSVLVGITLLRGLLRFYSRTLVFNAAREVEYELRNDLFAKLQSLPQSFYGHWRTGDLMSRCVNDVNAVRMLLGVGALNAVQTPLIYVGSVIAMFRIDWQLALLVLLPYPLFIAIARVFGRLIHSWSLLTQEGLGQLSNQLQESIAGIAVVKAYGMEPVAAARFRTVNQELYRRQLGTVRANAAMPAVTALLPGASMLAILVAGGAALQEGRLDVARFFAFAMLVYEISWPTFLLGWVVAMLQRGAAAMQRIEEILCLVPSIRDLAPATGAGARIRGEIELRNLRFAYPGSEERPALDGISLRVPAGSTLGIVGPIGSGKTTLANLIPRVLEVPDGMLFIDGVDINRIPLVQLRRSIAMVPQDAFLFSLTLGENVAFGRPDASAEEITRAVARAQLAGDLAELPHGIDTVVGERGIMLSGGQRQRAALARALLLDATVLILDDTLSAVDAGTQAAIQRELDAVFRGRTVIAISHHVSAVRAADQIVVLDGGRVAERGTHEELLRARGLYARLAREEEEESAAQPLARAVGAAS
jgi:ATP-binding cassette subfamily B protein